MRLCGAGVLDVIDRELCIKNHTKGFVRQHGAFHILQYPSLTFV
jgi:hypothetical protein